MRNGACHLGHWEIPSVKRCHRQGKGHTIFELCSRGHGVEKNQQTGKKAPAVWPLRYRLHIALLYNLVSVRLCVGTRPSRRAGGHSVYSLVVFPA